MIRVVAVFALLAVCAVGLSLPAIADTDAPTAVALHGGGASGTAQFDFGDISQMGGPQISHTFVLQNAGTAPLTLERFQPSCHCTTATLVPDADLPMTLAPGGQASVQVSVVVEPYLTGPLEKYVQVFAVGQDSAVATLTVTGTLHSLVVLDPLALDFGAAPFGHARSLLVTATMDARLAPVVGTPNLIASDPDIQITPLLAAPAASPGTRVYTYRVTLAANAALGPVRDLLQFARSPGESLVSGMALSDGPGVPVTGTVVGDVQSTPSMLAFGIVTHGHAAILTLHLAAAQGGLEAAQATADSPALQIQWQPGSEHARALQVILTRATPPGPVQSQVNILLPQGRHLRLPVTAYVSAQ